MLSRIISTTATSGDIVVIIAIGLSGGDVVCPAERNGR